jgi:hypothetical protein
MALKMLAEGEEIKLGNSTLVRERAGVYKAKNDSTKIREFVITAGGLNLFENHDFLLRNKTGMERNLEVRMQVV